MAPRSRRWWRRLQPRRLTSLPRRRRPPSPNRHFCRDDLCVCFGPQSGRKSMSVDTLAAKTEALDMEDVEYLRHGDKPLYMRIIRPAGPGPFPAMVELHGGVWTENDRTRSKVHHAAMAKAGIAIAALDFRQGEGGYPGSMQDINYAIRWLKASAVHAKTRPDLVGITGTS